MVPVGAGLLYLEAIDEGFLTEERLENYKKLKKEATYDGLNSREIERKKIDAMFAGFGGIKNAKNFIRTKNKTK